MKIVVIGGAGLIGAKTVTLLRRCGHEVVAASRRSGTNIITGEGLACTLASAQVVVDLSNPPPAAASPLDFFEIAGRTLFTAELAAGIRHHVTLSIVGADRTPGQRYYRAKIAQEHLVESSGIPYTVIRSTQFLEFLGAIADGHSTDDVVRIPPGLLQPIAADDAAFYVAGVALASPRNGIVEIAGPERARFADFIRRYLRGVGDAREVLEDPNARYFGGRLEEDTLVPKGEARLGQFSLETWRDHPGLA